MTETPPPIHYRLTDHARFEMGRRGITEGEVTQVLSAPERVELVRPGRAVYQSRVQFAELESVYLLRVVVDLDRQPAEVVTAYRTSKIDKYWKSE